MGAHIAAQICRYMIDGLGEKCKMLLGLDAAGIEFALSRDRYINLKDAEYVQLTVTDPEGLLNCGTKKAVGHDNIYIKGLKSKYKWHKHLFAYPLHMKIMAGFVTMIAEPNGDGIIDYCGVTEYEEIRQFTRPPTQEDQCLVGVYSTSVASSQPRNFTVSVLGGHADNIRKGWMCLSTCTCKKHKSKLPNWKIFGRK